MANNSEELVNQSLEKIATIDHSGYELRSVLAISPTALDEARAYDQSEVDLPLAGVPILIKDNIEVKGLPASAGSLALFTQPMQRDALLVSRLKTAGAIVVGATNLSEWANIRSTSSTSGWSAVGGLTANPWKHHKNTGGSSSGSGAAVAAGLTQWAIGSETDGSIICPASLNGTVGIKPSGGSIPSTGVIPISRSKDTPGPMTQTVSHAITLLSVLIDRPDLLGSLTNPRSLRVGVIENWRVNCPQTNALFDAAVSAISSKVHSIQSKTLSEPTDMEQEDEFDVLLHELSDDLADYLRTRPEASVRNLADVISFNLENQAREMKHFDQNLFLKAQELGGKSGNYQAKFERNLDWAVSLLESGLSDCDILLGCTFAPAWDTDLVNGDSGFDATWISMAPAIAGYPIGTLPMGLVDGMPVGIGVVARRGREDQLCSAMKVIEEALALGVLKPTFTRSE